MKKTNLSYYQQGDVILIKRDAVKGKKAKTLTIQEGEHTGHAHRITSGRGNIFQDGDMKFVKALGPVTITHEEHLPLTIEEGEYEVRIVRQKDPFSKIVSRVVD